MRKKLFSLFFILCLLQPAASMAGYNPVARPEATVRSGNMRFTVLTPEIIRIEWSGKGIFEDKATFTIVNRNLPVPNFSCREENGYLYITTDKDTSCVRTKPSATTP